EFSVVISVAILVSGFISLTLTPMLCSRFLHADKAERHGALFQRTEAVFQHSLDAYTKSLAWVMERRRLALFVSLLILAGTAVLYVAVPKGFIPSEDIDQIQATTEAAEGTSFDGMVRRQRQAAAIVQKDPNVAAFMSSLGGGGGGTSSNQGRMFIRLKPRMHRKLSADQVIRELSPKLATVPGIRVYLQNPPPVRIGARNAKSQYQFTLQGTDIASLYANATKLESKLRTAPALDNVTS